MTSSSVSQAFPLQVSPNTKFVGLALAFPAKALTTYLPHFLNHSNHAKDIPLDAISYHFYASSNPNDDVKKMANEFFEQTDVFINTVVNVEKIRKALSPKTKTMINELGTMHENAKNIPNEYWNLAGAQYAYEFARLSLLGNYFIYPV